jgi:hypothetical protein
MNDQYVCIVSWDGERCHRTLQIPLIQGRHDEWDMLLISPSGCGIASDEHIDVGSQVAADPDGMHKEPRGTT